MESDFQRTLKYLNAKSYNREKFLPGWLQDKRFSQWLQAVPHDDGMAFCLVCDNTLKARLSNLLKHGGSSVHEDNMNSFINKDVKGYLTPRQKVLRAELKLTALVVYRQLAMLNFNYLTPLLHQLLDDESETVKKMSLGRDKATNLVLYVLGPAQTDRLTLILKKQKFSAIMNESTDRSVEALMGIEVLYEDEELEQIMSSFWELIPVYDDDKSVADAQTLYQKFTMSFITLGIPLKNMVSFCSDTTNVMFGEDNSVVSKLKNNYPHILCVKCNAHLGHLCLKHAVSEDPLNCEEFVRRVYNYVKSSGKRSKYWKILQEILKLDPLTVKQPVTTRWLSLYQCVRLILRRWTALELFLQMDGTADAKALYELFYDSLLTKFTDVNQLFQTDHMVIPINNHQMQSLLMDILKMYMVDEYVERHCTVENIQNIDVNDSSYFRPLQEILLHENVRTHLRHCEENNLLDKEEIRTCLIRILIEAGKKLIEKFDNQQTWLPLLKFFHPRNAQSEIFHAEHPTIDAILDFFPFLSKYDTRENRKQINDDWKNLILEGIPDDIKKIERADHFWIKLKKCEYDKEIRVFKYLPELAIEILLVAPSNAGIERRWSFMNNFKDHKGNRQCTDTLRNKMKAQSLISGT